MSLVVLSLEDIHTYYGESHVIQGLSLHVGAGELVCIMGRNGAAKTTTIRSIIGYSHPRRGRVIFRGAQACQRLDNEREAVGQIIAGAAIEPHVLAVPAGYDPEPSCLISCSRAPLEGGCAAVIGRQGAMKPAGRARGKRRNMAGQYRVRYWPARAGPISVRFQGVTETARSRSPIA